MWDHWQAVTGILQLTLLLLTAGDKSTINRMEQRREVRERSVENEGGWEKVMETLSLITAASD